MNSLLSVANEILRLAKCENRPLTPLQLMKLTYVSYGFYMALFDKKKLFSERIEAWKYGPVMPDLYQATKEWGRSLIPFNRISDDRLISDEQISDLLAEVVSKYSHLNGPALSTLTHQSGTPWDLTFERGVTGKEIPDSIIFSYYYKNLV